MFKSSSSLMALMKIVFITTFICLLQAAKFADPQDACSAIAAESYRRWLTNDTRTDDITIIVVHIEGLHNV